MDTSPQAARRPLRSFVLRGGRLTPAQDRAFRTLWPSYGVDWQPDRRLVLPDLFGNANPVFLEIGFGNGETLVALAERHPDRNYLGVEVHRPGIGHLLLELEKRSLGNVRVLRQDAVELLGRGLHPGALEGVFLFFPDPWPKKRHHKRRILTPSAVRLLADVIRPGGRFHAATDWRPYAEHMLDILDAAEGQFRNAAGRGAFSTRPASRPITKFERRGRRLGHGVWDLIYRRI